MKPKIALLLGCAALGWAVTAGAAIEGRVVSGAGRPVEHARIEPVAGGRAVFSGPLGGFRLEDAEPPLELVVSHPRFQPLVFAVAPGTDEPVEVVLAVKQLFFEEIAVSANRGEESFSPVTVAADVVKPEEAVAPPTHLTELVATLPGVAENGQGGIFQTYSIRGISRLRVLTLVAGMRIVGERRAGVSASFLDPGLIGAVDVLRGPSSTYYGSGALGGVVQLFPRTFERWTLEAGYDSQGDESRLLAGWGDGDWSVGLARREAGDAETPGGEPLQSGFTQVSAVARRDWDVGRRSYRFEAIASRGDDIGKASTEFPDRVTTYPREEHLLLRASAQGAGRWSLDVWAHPSSLVTEVVRPGVGLERLDNDALDLGFDWQSRTSLAGGTQVRYGLDYYGRRGVTAEERDVTLTPAGRIPGGGGRTLDDGEEDELGLYGAFEWNVGRSVVLAGGRLAWQRQANAGAAGSDDAAATAFAGVVVPLGAGFELAANAGTGLRFPSLSERFFTGVTGRGIVRGNPALDPERSLNLDLGLRWYGESLFVSGYLFRNDIDRYIERIEIAPDLLTFRNLVEGRIEGVELQGTWQVTPRSSLGFGGHRLDGEAVGGERLADIPADRTFASWSWRAERWGWEARWEEREAKRDPGSGEKAIPAASLVSAALRWQARPGLELSLHGRNLLDEEYFNSADRRVPLAAGRGVGVSVRWRRAESR